MKIFRGTWKIQNFCSQINRIKEQDSFWFRNGNFLKIYLDETNKIPLFLKFLLCFVLPRFGRLNNVFRIGHCDRCSAPI